MKRNRKQNIKLLVLALILLLGIGFAAIATQLQIEGTLNVAKTSWDVHLENVQITTGSVTANPAPTTDDVNKNTTEVAYTMHFTKPGDFYEFTVDMVNSGTIDAMVDLVSNKLYESNGTTEKQLPAYLSNTTTYSDGIEIAQYHKLAAGTRETVKVRVEFKKDINISDLPSSSSDSMKFIFKADYKQADSNAIDRPEPWAPTFGAGTTFQPTYFAFGTPTTADITQPTQNVFTGIDASGNKGICINRGGATHCFQINNAAYEQTHLQQVFSDVGSYDESTGLGCKYVNSEYVGCNASDFSCGVGDYGYVNCLDNSTNALCIVNGGDYNSVTCFYLTS